MKSSARSKFSNFRKSISTKVLLVLILFILPINLLALGVSELALKNSREQTAHSVRNVIRNHLSDTEIRMEHMVSLLYSMRTNNENGRILTGQRGDTEYDLARQFFYRDFSSTVELTDSGDGAFLYMGKLDDLLIWNLNGRIHSDNDIRELVRSNCTEGTDLRGWNLFSVPGEYRDGEEYPLLFFETVQGEMYAGGWIELDDVASRIQQDLTYDFAEIVFGEEEPAAETKEEMLVSEYFETAGLYVTVKLKTEEINGTVLTAYYWYRRIAVILLLCLPFLYFILRRLLISPLRTINRAHEQVEKGNLDFRIRETGNSVEYQKAYDSFNRMAGNLKDLTIENYEKELQTQKMELQNLQLQIRPHFLLNAFNLIYNLAQEKEIRHVQEIIRYLSEYFRYIFRNDKELELFGKEERLIEQYIEMAKLRYPGCVEAEYEYDPRLRCVRIPPLLLHNFVENIVKHVVKQGTVTHIFIQGEYEDGTVSFHVMDDGPGIEEEKLETLNQQIHSGTVSSEHIGMSNAYLRLKHFYGPEADIQVLSEMDVGTEVILSFPYKLD